MRTVFNKLAIAAFSIGITVFSFSGCSDDIILEPLDSLLGNYEGQYTLTDLGQGGSGVIRADIPVYWIFSDLRYDLADTTATICSPKGEYSLNGDQINFDQRFEGIVYGVCNPSMNPVGDFSLRRPADSLILSQLVDDIFIEIRLKKIP